MVPLLTSQGNRALSRMLRPCLCGLVMLCASAVHGAQASEQIVSHPDHLLALFGYDPVAYTADGVARIGSPEHEILYRDLVWRFANFGSMDAFIADPERYIPAFGGHGALMMSRGAVAVGHPEVFAVIGGHVYLFSSVASRYAFLLEAESALQDAHDNWPDLRDTLAP